MGVRTEEHDAVCLHSLLAVSQFLRSLLRITFSKKYVSLPPGYPVSHPEKRGFALTFRFLGPPPPGDSPKADMPLNDDSPARGVSNGSIEHLEARGQHSKTGTIVLHHPACELHEIPGKHVQRGLLTNRLRGR